MADKKFVGIVKTIETKFGTLEKISISRKDFEDNEKNGWLNCIYKTGKSGKKYLELDTWEPKPKGDQPYEPKDDMPF
jgi:hypothetical protein